MYTDIDADAVFFFCIQDMSSTTFRDIFRGKEDELEETIDTEHTLLAKLDAYGIITTAHREAIKVILLIQPGFCD